MSVPIFTRVANQDLNRIAERADPATLSEEARYVFTERLGILAEDRTPTASEVAIAWADAQDVERRQRPPTKP